MITPDTKDWTWVLRHRCPECGFDASSVAGQQVAGLLRESVTAWLGVLAGDPGRLRQRPRPDVWSPLEYACHVRDVYVLFGERLRLMLTEEGPEFPDWDQDAAAVEGLYGEQDPEDVAERLAGAGERLATGFEAVVGAQWERTSSRSDGAEFTVDSFARYFIHDSVHHLYDVGAAGS